MRAKISPILIFSFEFHLKYMHTQFMPTTIETRLFKGKNINFKVTHMNRFDIK